MNLYIDHQSSFLMVFKLSYNFMCDIVLMKNYRPFHSLPLPFPSPSIHYSNICSLSYSYQCFPFLPCPPQILRLYAQYRQAEVHRKSLVFQKIYLQCNLDAFYQTEKVTFKMLADMGVVINNDKMHLPSSKYPRPYARFKAVIVTVLATFRFHYIIRRKSQYLQSKIDKYGGTISKQVFFKPAMHDPVLTSCSGDMFLMQPTSLPPGGLISISTTRDTIPSGIGSKSVSLSKTEPPQMQENTVTSSSNPIHFSGTDSLNLQRSSFRPHRTHKTSGSNNPPKKAFVSSKNKKQTKDVKKTIFIEKTVPSSLPALLDNGGVCDVYTGYSK